MPKVHPTSILEGEVHLADDVEIGPMCVVRGPVTIGAGCVLVSHVNLQGPLTLGEKNVCWPGACLGFAPQDKGYDPNAPGAGLLVGDGNAFREGFTAHRGKTGSPTRIGSRNYFMGGSHVGHDCLVGNDCVLANGALLGGHCEIHDRVFIGGCATVHQFCRVGRGVMMGGLSGATTDVPPFFTVTAINQAPTINAIGMRRAGMTPAQIATARWVYRTLCREGLPVPVAIERLRTRAGDPLVDEYLRFIADAKRPLCLARGRRVGVEA